MITQQRRLHTVCTQKRQSVNTPTDSITGTTIGKICILKRSLFMSYLITFRLSRRRRKMYLVTRVRLCVCVTVRGRMPTLPHGPGCDVQEWQGMPSSCALLGGFAIGARVAFL